MSVDVGCTVENGALRIHRFRDCLVLWDLTHAGQRGRSVIKLTLMPAAFGGQDRDAALQHLSGMLPYFQSLSGAETALSGWLAEHPGAVNIHRVEERGVDVVPAGFQSIKIDTQEFSLVAGYREFSVRDARDNFNEPTCIPASKGSAKSVQVFYRWVRDNQDKVRTLTFQGVLQQMQDLGVKYHYYCAID